MKTKIIICLTMVLFALTKVNAQVNFSGNVEYCQGGGCVYFIGASVQLFTAAGVAASNPSVTDVNGNYYFYNILPGDYYIVVNNTPAWTLVIAVCNGCAQIPPLMCYR